jgi:hypothetical protein
MSTPLTVPIVLSDGHLLDGRHRLYRARKEGAEHIPAIDFKDIGVHVDPSGVSMGTMGESLADQLLNLRDVSMAQGTADQGEYFRGMANAMEVAAYCVTGEEPRFVEEIDMKLIEPCELPPGMYTGLRYGYCVEIDGRIYKTRTGVRCTKQGCGGPSRFRMSDSGKLFEIHIPAKHRPEVRLARANHPNSLI